MKKRSKPSSNGKGWEFQKSARLNEVKKCRDCKLTLKKKSKAKNFKDQKEPKNDRKLKKYGNILPKEIVPKNLFSNDSHDDDDFFWIQFRTLSKRPKQRKKKKKANTCLLS